MSIVSSQHPDHTGEGCDNISLDVGLATRFNPLVIIHKYYLTKNKQSIINNHIST